MPTTIQAQAVAHSTTTLPTRLLTRQCALRTHQHRLARADQPLLLGGVDHGQRDAVLDRRAGLHDLKLGGYTRVATGACDAVQEDLRSQGVGWRWDLWELRQSGDAAARGGGAHSEYVLHCCRPALSQVQARATTNISRSAAADGP